MGEWLTQFLRLSEARATRSTAMQPILWLVGMFAGLTGASIVYAAATWIVAILMGTTIALAIVAVCMFIWLVRINPNLLRSEKFLLEDKRIEQSRMGDSIRGVIEETTTLAKPRELKGGDECQRDS